MARTQRIPADYDRQRMYTLVGFRDGERRYLEAFILGEDREYETPGYPVRISHWDDERDCMVTDGVLLTRGDEDRKLTVEGIITQWAFDGFYVRPLEDEEAQ